MLCEFTLPSDPEKKVRLHEATLADAIDFSAIDPDFEEEATSLFLEKVQERETYSDPREWTGEDRKYALFQYHINTTKYRTLPLSFTCSICGKRHTADVPLAQINEAYESMKGKPFREFPLEGHNVIVEPMRGADLELLEKYRYDLMLSEEELERAGTDAEALRRINGEIRAKRVRMAIFRLLCSIDMPFLDTSPNATRTSRRPKVEEYIKALPASQFREFFSRVEDALKDMRHGLPMSFEDGRQYLEIPGVHCDENPDAGEVVLRYPFRAIDIIPSL